jgi:histidyl-tRNA synthetase
MKPSIPKGTRDFSPQEMVKRNYIFDTIRKVFQSYGYQPIETPAFENSETLMGKYGEEGDRLIFKILNSGNYLADLPPPIPGLSLSLSTLTKSISEKALRYDLTVPFARYVVQHRNDITFPFKRYQIQPVWRADRPQKGRYREFYQCDADVIGSDSLLNEVELIQIIDEVFTKLGVPVVIKINNRKILQGIAEAIGAPDKMVDIAVAIDKIDKIGFDGIDKELLEKGLLQDQIDRLIGIIQAKSKKPPEQIKNILKPEVSSRQITDPVERAEFDISFLTNDVMYGYNESEVFKKGLKEIKEVVDKVKGFVKSIQFDVSLARGLNYYTGTIIEVKVDTSKCASQFTSSICGGGRYDDLTGIFGLPDVSGVGISFGADRIYDVIEELGLFPTDIVATTKAMLINFEGVDDKEYLKILAQLHKAGISSELYPDKKKINKQFEYADKRNIPYVVIVGGDEINKGVVKLRNMKTKEEKEMTTTQLIEHLKGI